MLTYQGLGQAIVGTARSATFSHADIIGDPVRAVQRPGLGLVAGIQQRAVLRHDGRNAHIVGLHRHLVDDLHRERAGHQRR